MSLTIHPPLSILWESGFVKPMSRIHSDKLEMPLPFPALVARPEADEIKQALSGVLCRCGTYTKIMTAFDALTGRST